jgi:hypothetical protein
MRAEEKPVVAAGPSLADGGGLGSFRTSIQTTRLLLYIPETPRRLHLPLGRVATDLDTEHGGTDANKRDVARQLGRLNVADLRL